MASGNTYRIIYIKKFTDSSNITALESLKDNRFNTITTYLLINKSNKKSSFDVSKINIKTIENIKYQELMTLKKVFAKKNINDIIHGNEHFDWWMFPIREEYYESISASGMSASYIVTTDDIRYLLNDTEFMKNYLLSIEIMIFLYDEDWKNTKNLYEVRLAKMLHSLYDFLDIAIKTNSEYTDDIKLVSNKIIKLMKNNDIKLSNRISKAAMTKLKTLVIQ